MTHLTSIPGKPPTGLGFSYADHVAGLVAALALLSALEYRHRTGEGQHIYISQVEAMASLLDDAILDYGTSGISPVPAGNRSPEAALHGVYRCRGDDRWCAISIPSDEEWHRFCQAIGNPEWITDSKFANLTDRLGNADELDRLVEGWTMEHTAEEVMTLLQKAGIAAGVVQDARDLASDPQLRARGFFIELEHPEMGKTISDATPIKLSHNPARYHRAAPNRGQDNNYVYRELLGMNDEELNKLQRGGVI